MMVIVDTRSISRSNIRICDLKALQLFHCSALVLFSCSIVELWCCCLGFEPVAHLW